jgi:peroxiredoxin
MGYKRSQHISKRPSTGSKTSKHSGSVRKPKTRQTPKTIRQSSKYLAIAAIAVVIIAIGAYYLLNNTTAKNWQTTSNTSAKVGNPAPNFKLPSLNGDYIELSSYKGKKVFIYLWSSNCHLDKINLYHINDHCQNNNENLEIITVNISDSKSGILEYMNKYEFSFLVVMDLKYEMFKNYGLMPTTPTSILVDDKGIIAAIKVGTFDNKNEMLCFINNSRCSRTDTDPPVISNATIFNITDRSAVINWTTSEDATGTARCISKDNDYHTAFSTTSKNKTHSLRIDKLKPETDYSITIISEDANGNKAEIENILQFITLKGRAIGGKIGNYAPDFTMETINGDTVSLDRYPDNKVMIVFLKTLYESTNYQLKFIEKAYQYMPEQKWQIIVVSSAENRQKVLNKLTNCKYTVALDDTGEVTRKFAPSSLQYTYFIDEDGVITDRKSGLFSSSDEILALTIKDPSTLAQFKDKIPPIISDINVADVNETSATIKWNTNEETTGQLQYWINYGDSRNTNLIKERTIDHELTISPLLSGMKYNFIVISKDLAGNEVKSKAGTFNTTPWIPTETEYVRVGNAFIIGADGHRIKLFNNLKAQDPDWETLIEFLKADKTDAIPYVKGRFVCADFAEMLHNNAEKAGIKAAYVCIKLGPSEGYSSGSGHALNAFTVTDKGLIYIDDTGTCAQDSCPRDKDKIAYLKVGDHYIPQSVFPEYRLRWGSMGELLEIESVQW